MYVYIYIYIYILTLKYQLQNNFEDTLTSNKTNCFFLFLSLLPCKHLLWDYVSKWVQNFAKRVDFLTATTNTVYSELL